MKAQWLRAGLLLLATGHALSPADNVANMVTLGIAVLLPLVLLAPGRSRRGGRRPRARDG
jgi:hypothetical protein